VSQIEGRRPVLEALRAGRDLDEIWIARGARIAGPLADIVAEAERSGVSVVRVERERVDSRALTAAPQGVIAFAPSFAYASIEDALERARVAREPALLLALDGVTDPHNVGALARSAEAAGAHAILLPRRRSAGITPTVEKAAAGALAHLPIVEVPNMARALSDLQDRGIWVVVLDADAATDVDALDLATEPLCLVVGSEGRGVSRLIIDTADAACRIPLRGKVGSLNASVAGAVALFAVVRKRTQAT